MKRALKIKILVLVLFISPAHLTGQKSIDQLPWKTVANHMSDEWYGSDESKAVAENVLLYQRDSGGWPKNTPFQKPLSEVEKAKTGDEKGLNDATLDNDATTTEMRFLARMYNKTVIEKYKASFLKGLNYIFEAQYDNGGWPQFYPLRKGYYSHITYNDNCMVNILELLKDIYNKKPLYGLIATDDIIRKARKSFNKGIDCILKTQINVKGKLTVWCAQHDEFTLLPVKARSYELPSFSGAESADIIKLLMEIPDPSPVIIKSIQDGMEWLDAHRIKNTRWESFINSDGLKDRKIVSDPNAGDMWARFYDLDTELPFVCDRDGIKKKNLEDIGYERRNGYNWYTDSPKELFEKYPVWRSRWVK